MDNDPIKRALAVVIAFLLFLFAGIAMLKSMPKAYGSECVVIEEVNNAFYEMRNVCSKSLL